ncbi:MULTISPECIES: hypothetical protein [unclassified Streptomyces]|uniref:hypothetical protein n=1 Tax=unclassified Streptomyces TaxID=2593676 RepID=UPI00081D6B4B|nr:MULTISPECIES: hypothetical protein [unclassified Streptomyces]MYZ37414.1 hypothetical protein [Streptomyces sp. SID4917]SCF91121.1 hypothetical protein GA0115259_104715 [Streptomyces sp. MnatMP-M17]
MDAGLAAVIGAAVGALGGMGGGLLSTLGQGAQQRRQQLIDRENRLEQTRREAYLVCMDTSKQLTAAWWKLANHLLAEDSTAEQRQQSALEAQTGWARFSLAADAASIAGPNKVAETVAALREAMWRMDRAGTSWYECARRGESTHLAACEAEYRAAEAARTQLGYAFQTAARSALHAEH